MYASSDIMPSNLKINTEIWYNNLDIRLEKTFNLSGYELNVYALMLNALSQENVRNVIHGEPPREP